MTSKFEVWLRLGRVSNLPTVWTNVAAALALTGVLSSWQQRVGLMSALSLFYVGGMFLNDAFDRDSDARERPERPIPAGLVSAQSVFLSGFVLLLAGGLGCVWLAARSSDASPARAALSGAALGACIIAYNAYHKGNPFSPLVMGLCRVFVYVTVAFTVTVAWEPSVGFGAAALLAHLIGLTYAAKQEARNQIHRAWPFALLAVAPAYGVWVFTSGGEGGGTVLLFAGLLLVWVVLALRFLLLPKHRSVPKAVVRLIAGISLVDALLIATAGQLRWALWAVLGCVLTRVFQRYIPGT